MAEGILKAGYGNVYDVWSAGTEPSRVNPYAIRVMDEIGIDISDNYSKHIEKFEGDEFDTVVTVCDHAKEICPIFPGAKKYLHHGFTDPSKFRGKDEEIMAGFREVRDEIKSWIDQEFSTTQSTEQ